MEGFEEVLADLHNHSCLSPCGSLEQSPALLAHEAARRGISLLALTDHNSALNAPAFSVCCRREGVVPLFGMEASSAEEVHVLCLFGEEKDALRFGEELSAHLPDFDIGSEDLEEQVIVDADEFVLGTCPLRLAAALELSFDELVLLARSRGALVIPAHVDRPYMSVGSQLGFLPPGPYAAVESIRLPARELSGGHSVISGSDSHEPSAIGRRPFRITLPSAWRSLTGRALLDAVERALLEGRIRPYWA
jgi:hypothetical protein